MRLLIRWDSGKWNLVLWLLKLSYWDWHCGIIINSIIMINFIIIVNIRIINLIIVFINDYSQYKVFPWVN